MSQKPSPGRVVLYHSIDGDTYVAIVSHVVDGKPTLITFYVEAEAKRPELSVVRDVPEGNGTVPGTWSWPPRV